MKKEADESVRTTPCAPLRVLWVSPKPDFAASMIFVERQIESLARSGIAGRTYHLQSRTSPDLMFRELRRLRAEIDEFQPDLVHAQYGTATAFLCVVATWLPLVVTFRGSDLNPDPEKSRLRCFLGRSMSQVSAFRARRVICVSEQLAKRLWWGRRKTTIIPSGIDTRVFCPRPRDEARAALGWNSTERIVFFNGSHRPLKRPDLARAAVAVARGKCGPIRLVELDGAQPPDRVPLMMNAADCLILTSDHEGSPNVVKEAIACGLPVVSRDVGDVRQRLAKVQPSQVVGDTPEELSRALVEILAQRERSNGPEFAREFSLESIAQQIVALYENALGRLRATDRNAGTA